MPAARITTTDLARLEQVSRILLTPLTAPSLDAWRVPATSEAARLLGTDKATFILPCDGEPLSYCEGNYPMTNCLTERREWLGALLDELADPPILVDRKGSIVHTNTAALRLLAADPFANRIDHSVKALACEVARALEPASRAKGLSRPERRLRTPYDGDERYRLCPTSGSPG